MGQLVIGALSDPVGRKRFIVAGMLTEVGVYQLCREGALAVGALLARVIGTSGHRGRHVAATCGDHPTVLGRASPPRASSPASDCRSRRWQSPVPDTCPPPWGAIAQEVIDVAVILNALRVLRPGRGDRRLDDDDEALARRFSAEHVTLRQHIEQVRAAADAIGVTPADNAVAMARDVHRQLVEQVLPHEQAEDTELYPMLARVLGGADPTATMTRAHVEIAHLVRRTGRLLDDIDAAGPDDDDLIELRRLLYGLHAILGLHTAQEDESYLSLADDKPARSSEAGPFAATRSE